MTSKAKKRVVLPTRPEPPNTEQILEDVQRAQPNDPVFVLLVEPSEDLPAPVRARPEAKRERLYRLTQSYVEMNHRLQKACSLLKEKCEELKLAGASLEQGILEMKQRDAWQTLAIQIGDTRRGGSEVPLICRIA
ncbi:UPF0449 protein C19orf25 homolog [Sphaerodactylus townsendi]|uniref:UPF0449 protein C19orf25 homolog n=1 Tax=Sphaerodactylus townsendi TaxID=933632 RepID=UPI0020267457|nr:UPF0449 protein C19orf25 homolog [Sphaerodactylus townsendi]XP_048357558.1 UPF0449 protein C19orf25 homolog [Sphaerodactylus townsendi]XP_048357567.1 UPF0449 protein C19orf25 homolog [Sphaerodactylus townsendi]